MNETLKGKWSYRGFRHDPTLVKNGPVDENPQLAIPWAHIDAWVTLPDHLHCVWTLPTGDDDFTSRWWVIKQRFRNPSLVESGGVVLRQAVYRRSGRRELGDHREEQA